MIVHSSSPEFIQQAKQRVPGDFYIGSYEDIVSGNISFSKLADAIVINFALIGRESTADLLAALPKYLSQNGRLLIQTLHPYTRKETGDYTSGWKQGSWDGLGDQFVLPYEWYFRTLEDWMQLLKSSGFKNIYITETTHPVSGKLLSVIFACDFI